MSLVCSKCKIPFVQNSNSNYLHLLYDMWDNSVANHSINEEFSTNGWILYLGIIVLNEWNNLVKCLCILCIKWLPYHFVNRHTWCADGLT